MPRLSLVPLLTSIVANGYRNILIPKPSGDNRCTLPVTNCPTGDEDNNGQTGSLAPKWYYNDAICVEIIPCLNSPSENEKGFSSQDDCMKACEKAEETEAEDFGSLLTGKAFEGIFTEAYVFKKTFNSYIKMMFVFDTRM